MAGYNNYDYGSTWAARQAADNGGSSQGGSNYGGAQTVAGTEASGVRAGSSNDDPWISYWKGASTPAQMQVQQAAGTQAAGVDGQVTGAQGQLLGQLQAQASGQGPSLAAMQAQQAQQANIRGAAALGASGRSNPGAAAYAAQQQAGAANQATAGQAAQARLMEERQAQGELMGLTGQMGNQQLQNNEFNANLGQQNNQFNAGAANAQNQFYNQLMGQQVGQTNQYLENKDIARTNNNAQLLNNAVTGSDRRIKKNVTPGGHSLSKFFDHVGHRKAVY